MVNETQRDLVAEASQIIYDGFIRYNINFYRITRRARSRFEGRDWKGHQQDIVDRVDLYEKCVNRIVLLVRKTLDERVQDHDLWHEIRSYFGLRLDNMPDAGFIKTFFNSITRRIFDTIGTDLNLEFVSSSFDEDLELARSLYIRHYPYWGALEETFETVLEDFAHNVAYADIVKDRALIADQIEAYTHCPDGTREYISFEFIDSVFYQAPRAYLVGRIVFKDSICPLVIALKNGDAGVEVDAVLMSEEQVSIVFGYTRSYYFAELNSVMGAVGFLHSILPNKPINELYTILGRLRQGKTERVRTFNEHLKNTNDQFVLAAGDRGLVMIVFTLPSYDLVFKVIRDRFGYPKTISRQDVLDKYKLVSKHDRAGRLIDTQEFRNMEFPLARFSKELLEELAREASKTTRIVGDDLLLEHLYVERRVRPLNLYIREVSREMAELAILDYGQALRDLAQTNIFPGDLLLKNFGLTRHKRVLFYDYDEVALVTECNFREIPEARDDMDEMRSSSWFYVNEDDIFPEEFINFLAMDQQLQEVFRSVHADLLTADYWRSIKQRHLQGKTSVVIPYSKPGQTDQEI